jgi:hypothetical protein
MSMETKKEILSSSTSSFPGSKKVYVEGSRADIRVPMREIKLSPTTGAYGEQENAPIRVYDTSGAYTDEKIQTDIRAGILPNRLNWILERGITESPVLFFTIEEDSKRGAPPKEKNDAIASFHWRNRTMNTNPSIYVSDNFLSTCSNASCCSLVKVERSFGSPVCLLM